MKKFSEERQKEVFDWYKFLNKRKYSIRELVDAQELSGDWTTCACGQQCAIIPRYKKSTFFHNVGEPKDKILRKLGFDFHTSIQEIDPEEIIFTIKYSQKKSLEILNKIEERSIVLIKKIKSKSKKK